MTKVKYYITGSIVLYNSDPIEIKHVIECFLGRHLNRLIYLIDNSAANNLSILATENENIKYIHTGKNIGYGAGHNIAIRLASESSSYHVILNPDVSFESNIISKIYDFMELNPEVALVSPKIKFPDGKPQNMCRQLPTPFDLLARRFFPGIIKPLIKDRLERYTLEGLDLNKRHNIPNLPGSFMFIRQTALSEVGGFDEKFFMYVEDVDLTRRLNQRYKTLYFPDVEIIHVLEQSSYKFNKLLAYHIKSAIYYFNKWGWFIDKERSICNKRLQDDIRGKAEKFKV
jgi:GT2 family glycosyltransferase